MLETELYDPIKQHFESLGYSVQAEVKHCDLVAMKNTSTDLNDEDATELIVVELKTSANLGLLIQATERQAITPNVYVAIPEKRYRRKQWLGIRRVIKQLGLGLLVVSITPLSSQVNEYFAPSAIRRTTKRKRKAVVKEATARLSSYNVGGSTGSKIMTAYKQHAIILACFLEHLGEATPSTLRALGNPDNTTRILADNHYNWFKRIRRGVYGLDQSALTIAADFEDLWQIAQGIVVERIRDQDNRA